MKPKYKEITLLSSLRAFLLFTPTFYCEATWKKATKCNKKIMCIKFATINDQNHQAPILADSQFFLEIFMYFDV